MSNKKVALYNIGDIVTWKTEKYNPHFNKTTTIIKKGIIKDIILSMDETFYLYYIDSSLKWIIEEALQLEKYYCINLYSRVGKEDKYSTYYTINLYSHENIEEVKKDYGSNYMKKVVFEISKTDYMETTGWYRVERKLADTEGVIKNEY